ncbi:PIN domain-containing protein, partial [Enterobacter ludwigii]
RVALRLAGTPIGPNDTAIAGHAIAAGAILVTNNTREFERVPGLVLEDWVK